MFSLGSNLDYHFVTLCLTEKKTGCDVNNEGEPYTTYVNLGPNIGLDI
jgi:hypothetical protein